MLIAELEQRPVAHVAIIDPAEEEEHYWGDVASHRRALDIWIGDERDLGRRLGTEIMQLALARCFAAPDVAAVLIDPLASNTRAIRFYERLGFRSLGRRHFAADDCLVMRLQRTDWRPAKL